MVIVSALLYFIDHRPGLTTLAMAGIGLGVGTLLAIWRPAHVSICRPAPKAVVWCSP
jgi:hypothetical protein